MFWKDFLDFWFKSAPKTLEIHVFFDKEKLIAKTLIIPYVLEGFWNPKEATVLPWGPEFLLPKRDWAGGSEIREVRE